MFRNFQKNSNSLRIFVAASELPKPDWNSGDRRFLWLLRLLAQHYQVDLCVKCDERPLLMAAYERYTQILHDAGVQLLPYYCWQMAEGLADQHYDVGLFEFYGVAEEYMPVFRRCQSHAKIMIDSVDVQFVRESSGVKIGVIVAAQAADTQRRELAAYRQADVVIAVTEADRDILYATGGMNIIKVIPNILPIRPRSEDERPPHVIFIGGFRHPPNLDGVRWFVQEIWPIIQQHIPTARFLIIGSHPPAELHEFGKFPGIEVVGYVPETTPYLDRAALMVAPLRYGAGMKGKINEALASGVPIVTTTVGVQGLNVKSGEHVMIADQPDDFASAVIALLQNPAHAAQIGYIGQQQVAVRYTPEIIEPQLQALMDSLCLRRRMLTFGWWKYVAGVRLRRIVCATLKRSLV